MLLNNTDTCKYNIIKDMNGLVDDGGVLHWGWGGGGDHCLKTRRPTHSCPVIHTSSVR